MTKIVIIGGGPGGYVAAIRAAQLGADVTLIEKEKIGGTCLNVGCVPTKSLLYTAEIFSNAKQADIFGVEVDSVSVNMEKAQQRKNQVVSQLVGGVTGLLSANKVDVVLGTAKLEDAKTVTVEKNSGEIESYKADRIIIAVGSRPAMPPIPGLDSPQCVTSTKALDFDKVPSEMVIIGGGVIGVEMATIYATLGCKVTIVEMLPQILPAMDHEMGAIVHDSLEKLGITILADTAVKEIQDKGENANVVVEKDGQTQNLSAQKVLVSTGRTINTDGLGLENAGIRHDRGRVIVDDLMQTNVPGIFAIGDCIGGIMLAHAASAHGEIAAQNAMGYRSVYNEHTCPSCVYTDPEFASVGLTEEQAKAQGIEYSVGKFPLVANAKSLIVEGQGMVKILAGTKHNEILGLHIVGPRATDIIGEGSLAIKLEATMDELIETIHAHPTVYESVREGALVVKGRPIHIM